MKKTPQKFFLGLKFHHSPYMHPNWQTLLYQGIIPGPKETWSCFAKRAERLEKTPEDQNFKDPLTLVERHFAMRPSWVRCHYTKEGLGPFELAAAFINEERAVEIRIKPYLRGRKRFLFYKSDEVIAHEIVHAIRAAYDEPQFEEFLASRLFSSPSRRFFGSLIENSYEAWALALPFIGLLPLAYFALRYLKKKRAFARLSYKYPVLLTDDEILTGICQTDDQTPRSSLLNYITRNSGITLLIISLIM